MVSAEVISCKIELPADAEGCEGFSKCCPTKAGGVSSRFLLRYGFEADATD